MAGLELSGSLVAIVTPFSGGKFDERTFRKLIEFQIDNGTAGIVPCGTTGESATLTHDEHIDVVKCCVDAVAGRVPVIAGAGSNATAEAVELTQGAKDCGADAALHITPYYNKPTQTGLRNHYRRIADEVDLPLVVYNCPGRTGGSIDPETLCALAEHPNIVAVKDATGDLDWTTAVNMGCDLTILSGDDSATVPMMALGAAGVISVSANIAPRMSADMCAAASAGNWTEAREIHERMFRLNKVLFIESNPIPIKAACEMMGLIGPEIRDPLCVMSAAGREKLRTEMLRMGLLGD